MVRIGIVAGESSGDLLGARLIEAIRSLSSETQFAGIAGPAMTAQGCECWEPSESLAVLGLFEVLSHLPRLIRVRRTVRRRLLEWRPDVFVGIDAPEFNFGLEKKLRGSGIPTVQYVSPQVWAWRQGRVKSIARSTDLVLCLLPFEKRFFDGHDVPALFVGHPLADEIPLISDRSGARERLGLDAQATVIALLPGSRVGEVRRLGADFVGAAVWLAERDQDLWFVAPMANRTIQAVFEELAQQAPGIRLRLLDGQARDALGAADGVLVASGTASLETTLVKRPMVVAYRVGALTYWLSQRLGLLKVPYIAMPNLLAGERVVPEFLQDEVTPAALGEALWLQLEDADRLARQQRVFASIHDSLRQGASLRAAEAVLRVAGAEALAPRAEY